MAKGDPINKYQQRQGYITKANETELKYNLPHNILVGVMATESKYNPRAVSNANAKGLMQFMPETAKEFGIDPYNADQSIDAAGKYLARNYKQLRNWDDTLRSYNMGLGNVNKWRDGKIRLPTETAEYVGKVHKNMGLEAVTEGLKKVKNDYKNEYTSETTTTPLINFVKPTESGNYATVSDLKEEVEVKKESEALTVLKEDSFLKDYAFKPVDVVEEEQDFENNKVENSDLVDIYNQVSEFVDTPYAQNGGKIIKDNNGYWNPKNWGKTVEIDSNIITMKGVNQPLIGYAPKTGEKKLMMPNNEYLFEGADKVIESPLTQNEIDFLNSLK